MIFHQHKVIYFHIGKTAGTSVEFWLWPERPQPHPVRKECLLGWDPDKKIWLQHATPRVVKKLVGARTFADYFKFTTVRNPFARMLSVYRYGGFEKRFGDFPSYVRALPKLVEKHKNAGASHILPQTDYVHLDGRCVCDLVAQFEHLPQCLAPVANWTNLIRHFPHLNRRREQYRKTTVSDYYDEECIRIVREVYNRDFDLFGYSDTPDDLTPKLIERNM